MHGGTSWLWGSSKSESSTYSLSLPSGKGETPFGCLRVNRDTGRRQGRHWRKREGVRKVSKEWVCKIWIPPFFIHKTSFEAAFTWKHCTGLCKKVGARLGEKFCPDAASHDRPCQAGAGTEQNNHIFRTNPYMVRPHGDHMPNPVFCFPEYTYQ